jgi:hypothetical protein
MAVEKEDKGNVRSGGNGKDGPDPENGWAGGLVLLREMARKTLYENLTHVFVCIADDIQAKHLPTVKFLVELVTQLDAGEVVPASAYESLAQLLWKSVNELEAGYVEQETGDGK